MTGFKNKDLIATLLRNQRPVTVEVIRDMIEMEIKRTMEEAEARVKELQNLLDLK
jgi:hypothetical protein